MDGDIAYRVRLDPAISTDPVYLQLDPDDVDVINLDDDLTGPGDTGDTGDTGDSGDSGVTPDPGDSADTGEPTDTDTELPTDTDETDTEQPTDTDDTDVDAVPGKGESGGCGCDSGAVGGGWLLLGLSALAVRRRRRALLAG